MVVRNLESENMILNLTNKVLILNYCRPV